MPLTPTEAELAASLGFDPAVCEYIKRNLGDKPLERALRYDDDYKLVDGDGLAVLAPKADIAAFLNAHRNHLGEHLYRAYLSKRQSPDNRSKGEELLVLRTDDPYEIVRQRKTCGPNYDVSNEDVLAKLKEWEKLCRFDIVQVEPDTLVLDLLTLPVDLCGFAEDVYGFCPDTVDQGVGALQEDACPEVFARVRELCPGRATEGAGSAATRVLSDESDQSDLSDESDDELADEFAATAEIGVKLLAYSFQEAKQVYLWWD